MTRYSLAQEAYAISSKPKEPFVHILATVSRGIQGCIERDQIETLQALEELQSLLDFEHAAEYSAEVADVYHRCEQLVRMGRYGETMGILVRLKGGWKSLQHLSVPRSGIDL